MIKEVVIRQAFAALDIALAVVVAVAACFAVMKWFEEPLAFTPLNQGGEASERVAVAGVGPLEEYAAIMKSGLFGDAGLGGAKAPEAVAAPVETPVVETSLPLRLLGTAAAFPTDPLGTAVIENSAPSVRKTQTYYLNQPLIDQVVLAEIYPRSVVLWNKATNAREILKLDQDKGGAAPIAGPQPQAASAPAPRAQLNPGGVTLNRQELFDQYSGNYADVLSKINPMPYMDANGKMAGITSSSLSANPVAQKLGLMDNDVLQTVNGVQIDSMEKLADIVSRFQNANTFWLGVLRQGKPQMINFKLE
ncbi:MAG TPA: type II secretion system protein N [Candidatus Hydrogenedentes bacterium]|nr:type II secretion system protein N [Candidatus Hydrogenedentota bacterium]HOS03721.1 type II secretion system protein N [Candidatus Hydrogenedentota bacterium]